jgi:hypothetical protein
LQQHMSRLAADVSFAKAREHLLAMLPVTLSPVTLSKEALRRECHRHGQRMAEWQAQETATPAAFTAAAGEVEFSTDAGKVNTLEEGWKDLKIASFQKRPRAEPATPAEWASRNLPEPTARVAWASIAPAKQFRRTWRRWSRRLGVGQAAEFHVLADGADWIWRSVNRVFTGSQQTLDVFHGCGHLAKAGERLYGEGTETAGAFLAHSRQLLLESGWSAGQASAKSWARSMPRETRPSAERLWRNWLDTLPSTSNAWPTANAWQPAKPLGVAASKAGQRPWDYGSRPAGPGGGGPTSSECPLSSAYAVAANGPPTGRGHFIPRIRSRTR